MALATTERERNDSTALRDYLAHHQAVPVTAAMDLALHDLLDSEP